MKKTPKQILALAGVVLLVALYIVTLIVALIDFPGKNQVFTACVIAGIALPVLIWLMIWSIGKLKRKGD